MIPLVPWKWRCLLKTSFLVIFISNLLKNLLESFLSSRQLHINLVWPECVHVDATLWIYWGWKRWCYFLWTTFAPNWSNFSIFNIFNILSYIKYMTHFVKTWCTIKNPFINISFLCKSCLSLPREAGSVPQSGFNGFCGSPGAPDDREAEQKQSSANRKLSQI